VDDVPSVAPEDSGLCEQFSEVYRALCKRLNVKLAENCPLNDKAFEVQVRGKVLGVMFDATDLTWRLSEKKIAKAKNSIVSALSKEKSGLRDWQRLVGRLKDISQLCPFLRIFKSSINEVMSGQECQQMHQKIYSWMCQIQRKRPVGMGRFPLERVQMDANS